MFRCSGCDRRISDGRIAGDSYELMSKTASVQSVQVGAARPAEPPRSADFSSRPWVTGFGKQTTSAPVLLTVEGLAGDQQADRKNHGGPDKAVCVYPAEHYRFWQTDLQLEITCGGFGENLTLDGWTEADVCIGDVWQIGSAQVQVSQPRQPCWKLSRWWGVKDLAARVQANGKTGWYLRVLQEGKIRQGDTIQLVDRSAADWPISTANQTMHHDRTNIDAASALAAVPTLSASWKQTLQRRVDGAADQSTDLRLKGSL